MTTTYGPKGSLDTYTVPLGSATLGGSSPTHRAHHVDIKDAVLALEQLGVPMYNARNYLGTAGAKADKRTVTDGATSTNTALTSATAAFTAADVGKLVRIARASTAVAIPLTATIVSRTNATTIVVSLAADFTVSAKTLIIDGPNGRRVTDGVSTAGSTTITSATAAFVAGDVGSTITLYEASATAHVTTIASVTNGTTAVLTAASTRTVTGAVVTIATDDTAAIQACLDAANTDGGGGVYLPPGTYVAADMTIYSNTFLFGAGRETSVLEYLGLSTTTYLLSTFSGSGGTTSVTGNRRNINISKVGFVGPQPYIGGGPSGSMGTAQSSHLLNINATSDMTIDNCKFTGWLGDAIYIGSSNAGATERHNERITIQHSFLDGVNKNNRNAVSIIDGDNITISDNTIARCTRPDMPGAVDVEPNNPGAAYPVTRNIIVKDNVFIDIGRGIAGVVGIILKTDQPTLTTKARAFMITNNRMFDCLAQPLFLQQPSTSPGYNNTSNEVWFVENICLNNADGYPFEIDKGLRGVHIIGNTFANTWGGAQIGFSGPIYDLEISNNVFRTVGFGDGYGLIIYQANGAVIDDNTFELVGTTPSGPGYVINAAYTGTVGATDDIMFSNNRVVQGLGTRTTKVIHKHASHTATNWHGDNNSDLGLTRDITLISDSATVLKALTADATTNSTTTAAKITSLDTPLAPGTYFFKYMIRYQSGAATTGVKFSVNHTGTVTHFIYNMSYVDAAATASTGAPSQAANASTAQVYGAYSARAKSTAAGVGPTLSVDTLNADMLMIIEGTCVVTATGNLELYHASEVAAASTVKAGTVLSVQRAA